jgi:hypothetical protein
MPPITRSRSRSAGDRRDRMGFGMVGEYLRLPEVMTR